MLGTARLTATLFVLATLLTALAATTAGASPVHVPGRYIVVFKDKVNNPVALAETQVEQRDGELGPVYTSALKGYAAELSASDVAALERDPRVDYVSPDMRGTVAEQTIPTGIDRIYGTANPAADIDGSDDERVDVDVAVIDTGVDDAHPDLDVAGYSDCTLEEAKCVANAGDDVRGHGTMVAGIVGAIDNGFGAVGVAPGARIWSLKGISDEGWGYVSWWISAVDWITAHASTIEVANMSLGCRCAQLGEEFEEVPAFAEAVKASTETGVVYAVAAMNWSEEAALTTPAAIPEVLTVSAVSDFDGLPGGLSTSACSGVFPGSRDDVLAPYSNWGSSVDIAGPGECIYSTLPTEGSLKGADYGFGNGTSAASPHVAGAAALLAAADNPEDGEDVKAIGQKLINSGSLDWVDDSGDGIHEPLLDLRPTAAEAITRPASALRPYSARLNALVNPGGLGGDYYFEYGTTTSYGKTAPASGGGLGPWIKDQEVGSWIDVEPETTYHFRVAVSNELGTTYGADRTFETASWSRQPNPKPAGSDKDGQLSSVSCATAASCVAVGARKVKTGGGSYVSEAFAERWNGKAWSIASTPSEIGERLDRVSCSSAEFCMAIGSSSEQPLAATWDGTSWAPLALTLPSQANQASLADVSCSSESFCVVVGAFSETELATEAEMLIERWDGSQWTVQAAPNVAGNQFNRLAGISCTSAGHCLAVGSTRKSPFPTPISPVATEWDGASWALTPTPPTPSSNTRPGRVSCISVQFCMAIGTNPSGSYTASWDGVGWQLRSSGMPGELADLSCSDARSCDAVNATDGMHWDGREWLERDPVAPEASEETRLGSISCPLRSTCFAVGWYLGGNGVEPLAERALEIHRPRFEADSQPTAIVGDQPAGGEQAFTLGSLTAHCTGSFTGKTTQASASFTLEAIYTGCQAFGFNAATVDMRTCDYVVELDNAGPPYTGSLDLVCAEAGDAIRIVGGSCEARIPPQTGLEGLSFSNAGVGLTSEVQVEIASSGLGYTVAKDGFLCPFTGTGSYANGSTEAILELGGEGSESSADFYLSGEEVAPNGVRVSGEESAEPSAQPQIGADRHPTSIVGTQAENETSIVLGSTSAHCTGGYEGAVEQASASFTLEAIYTGCQAFGFNAATVDMRTCDYVVELDNAGPPYTGSLDLVCAEAGDAIRIVGGSCEARIPPQTGLEGLSFSNFGEGGASRVSASISPTGLEYTVVKDGFLCPFPGTGSYANGTMSSTMALASAL